MIQWLRLCAPSTAGPGSIPGQGTRSHMRRLKILRAATRTQGSQIHKQMHIFKKRHHPRRSSEEVVQLGEGQAIQKDSWGQRTHTGALRKEPTEQQNGSQNVRKSLPQNNHKLGFHWAVFNLFHPPHLPLPTLPHPWSRTLFSQSQSQRSRQEWTCLIGAGSASGWGQVLD